MLNLVCYERKSIEEVTKIVGVPTNTVKTRMFYARHQLAELLREAGVDGLRLCSAKCLGHLIRDLMGGNSFSPQTEFDGR